MPKVHAGHQPFIHLAQLQHLGQIPQLVDLPHGLRTEGHILEPLFRTGGQDCFQIGFGNVQGFPTGALHQRAGVEDDPIGSHPLSGTAGGSDIADGLFDRLWVRIGQTDKVRGVEGQSDACLGGIFSDLPCGGLPHPHALTALVLVGVQADGVEPGRCIGTGFADGFGKGVGISSYAE